MNDDNHAKCTMCGEREPTTRIPDPNGSGEWWNVCDECDEFIAFGQTLAIATILEGQEKAEQMIAERSR